MKESNIDKGDLLSGANAAESKTPASQSSTGAVLSHRAADASVTKEEVVQQADAMRQQLMELQRKREELEREKNELEELRRKQDEYELGRKEMMERLNRSLVLLEHEQIETERRVDNVQNALASFKTVKEQLESIREDQWNNSNLKDELTKALAVVETARNEFNHYRARLDVLDETRNPEAAAVTGPLAEFAPGDSPLARLKITDLIKVGFALSLPIIILGIILLIVVATRK